MIEGKSNLKYKETFLLIIGFVVFVTLLATSTSFDSGSTNKMILGFVEPIFDFLKSIVSGIIDFIGGFLS